jgi:2-dehydro-3-deoxy-D-arabinonate dehydratase
MKLFRTPHAPVIEHHGQFFALRTPWDELLASPDLHAIAEAATRASPIAAPSTILAPAQSQEVWAAGVTYFRSRTARIDESKDAGGGTFYDRVYSAERPELFFKSIGRRVSAPGAPVRIRRDARWSVPEPELTLFIDPRGHIAGYTIGNDMSSRDIEGENPLYLPQAKMYDGACALGPCILLAQHPIARETAISIEILRNREPVFAGNTTLNELKREPTELAAFLFREMSFPDGVFLMTGTGIVPGDDFTLASGDHIRITIEGIGTLENTVA